MVDIQVCECLNPGSGLRQPEGDEAADVFLGGSHQEEDPLQLCALRSGEMLAWLVCRFHAEEQQRLHFEHHAALLRDIFHMPASSSWFSGELMYSEGLQTFNAS